MLRRNGPHIWMPRILGSMRSAVYVAPLHSQLRGCSGGLSGQRPYYKQKTPGATKHKDERFLASQIPLRRVALRRRLQFLAEQQACGKRHRDPKNRCRAMTWACRRFWPLRLFYLAPCFKTPRDSNPPFYRSQARVSSQFRISVRFELPAIGEGSCCIALGQQVSR
jgi:hypothetical protein